MNAMARMPATISAMPGPAQRLRHVAQVEFLADAGHQHDGEREAQPAADGKRQRLVQTPKLRRILQVLHDLEAGEQDRAVGRDQRQKDAERLVQRREELAHVHFDELHRAGDHEDVDDVAEDRQVDCGRPASPPHVRQTQVGQGRSGRRMK